MQQDTASLPGLFDKCEEECHDEPRGGRDDVGEPPAERRIPGEEGEGEAEEGAEVVDSVGHAALRVVEVVRDDGDRDGPSGGAAAQGDGDQRCVRGAPSVRRSPEGSHRFREEFVVA